MRRRCPRARTGGDSPGTSSPASTPQLRDRVLAAVSAAATRNASVRGAQSNIPWLAAAAALVLAATLGACAAQLRGRINWLLEEQLRAPHVACRGWSERQIADARQSAIRRNRPSRILAAPDLARANLAGQSVAPGASGRAFWSRSRGLVFTGSDLSAASPWTCVSVVGDPRETRR